MDTHTRVHRQLCRNLDAFSFFQWHGYTLSEIETYLSCSVDCGQLLESELKPRLADDQTRVSQECIK